MIIQRGDNTVLFTVIVDEEVHRRINAVDLGDNIFRNIDTIPNAQRVNNLPKNFTNPLVITYSSRVGSGYIVNVQLWLNFTVETDSSLVDVAFLKGWNTSIVGDISNVRDATVAMNNIGFAFPGTYESYIGNANPSPETFREAISALESGSQWDMANAQTDIPYVGSILPFVFNTNHYLRGSVEVEAYDYRQRVPVVGFGTFENFFISNIIKSNQVSLVGSSVNPVNVTAAIASGTAAAITSARQVAGEVANNPDVRDAVNQVRDMIPDNLLPISASQWQLAKDVVVYGGMIFGATLLIKSINAGVGKS